MAAGLPPDPPLDPTITPGQSGHVDDHEVIAGTLALLKEAAGMTVAEIAADPAFGTAAAMTPTEVVQDAGAQSVLTGAFAQVVGDSNGVDDTAMLNTALAAAGVVRGKPGETYLISSPLSIPSDTTLDMTGATVRLIAGSNCQMLKNAAQTAQRTVTDAAITAGTTTLTSATAAFTTADTGRSITVTGALNATSPLTATMTYVNSTTVTLSQAAAATVSGATARIHTRDSNVRVTGGIWDRQNNGGATPPALSSISIAHADGVKVAIERYTSTGGKYAVLLADVTRFSVWGGTFDSDSDGVHVNGPASFGSIRDIRGTAGDDLCSLTANNYTGYNETAGDITDVQIDAVQGISDQNVVRIVAGVGTTVDRVDVNGVYGAGANHAVSIGDDAGSVNTQGGTYGTIGLRNVHANGPSGASQVFTSLPNVASLTIGGSWNNTSGPYGVQFAGTGTLDHVTIDGYTVTGAGSAKLPVLTTQTLIHKLDIVGIRVLDGPTGGSDVVRVAAGVVTDLTFDRPDVRFGDTSGPSLVAFSGTGSVVNLNVLGGYIYQGRSGLINTVSTTPLCSVVASGTVFKGTNRLTNLASPAEFDLRGVTCDTLLNAAIYLNNAASTAVVRGGPIRAVGSFTLLDRTASQSVRVNGPSLPVNVSLLTPTDGDLAFNSNAALACGTGPCVYQTTAAKWKGLYSGATN